MCNLGYIRQHNVINRNTKLLNYELHIHEWYNLVGNGIFPNLFLGAPKIKKYGETPPSDPPHHHPPTPIKMVVNVFGLVRTVKLSDLLRRIMYNVAYLKKIGLKLTNNFCETHKTSLLLWTKNGVHLMVPGL